MSDIRFSSFPRTEPAPEFVEALVAVFRVHEATINTRTNEKGLSSDQVLGVLRNDLEGLGFEVERGKKRGDKIERPVLFGENGVPAVRYEIDAYHPGWRCGLEVEAGRGWMGNAIYRDLVLAMVMVDVDCFVVAVANTYKYRTGGRVTANPDYENAIALADTLYSHTRVSLPYRLTVIGY
ncbi:MAG: hypothetical protein OXU39_09605 [Gemmatimonadota bacterium]|nr:hypothetical protein [Gemmatimonadota bacterium]MDE3006332.1 hypothetical protein [Gemmatimonadota bacterium]